MQVGLEIAVRRLNGLVAEPQGDDAQVDAGLEQMHCCRVAEDARRDALSQHARAVLTRGGHRAFQHVGDTVARQRLAARVGERERLGIAELPEPLLRAVAAELGLGRAVEILQGERARVRAVLRG